MYDQHIISTLIDKKCFVCQSSIKLVASNNENIIYACALTYNENYVFQKCHYIIKISKDEYNERIQFCYKNKNYHITQWHDNFLLIDIRDDKDLYLGSVDVDVTSKTFDFLNDDLEKIINRLKIIITFQ